MTPKFTPENLTRRIVRGLASERIGVHRIALLARVSVATLRRDYATELNTGHSRATVHEFFEAPITWPDLDGGDIPVIRDGCLAFADTMVADSFEGGAEAAGEARAAGEPLALVAPELARPKATLKRRREGRKKQT